MFRSLLYDALILRLTSHWYQEVLDRVPPGARVLDVGIGTAGALLANAGIVREKHLRITGLDIDQDYIRRAREKLACSALSDQVSVHLESLYDHNSDTYDIIYFSGSFMLMPEPARALMHCRKLLTEDGRIFFTQTIQNKPSPWLERLKPSLRRLTSIDFGQVTYEAEFRNQIHDAGFVLDEYTELRRQGNRSECLAAASRPVAGDRSEIGSWSSRQTDGEQSGA